MGRDSRTTPKPAARAASAMRGWVATARAAVAAADRLAKLIPEQLNITIDEALAQEPDLKEIGRAHV